MTRPDRSLLLAKLLDLHLSRTINREQLKDRVMHKFVQLAEDVEADLKGLDDDADELQRRRLQVKDRTRLAVNNQHRIQDRIEEGLAALEKVADAAGLQRNSRTAAELAQIAEEEARLAAAAGKGEGEKVEVSADEVGEVPLGEVSGATPESFQEKP